MAYTEPAHPGTEQGELRPSPRLLLLMPRIPPLDFVPLAHSFHLRSDAALFLFLVGGCGGDRGAGLSTAFPID